MMRSTHGILLYAVALTVGLWAGTAGAQTEKHSRGANAHPLNHGAAPAHHGEKSGHSHERCELHHGSVAMTKAHHFETVFAPDGVCIYMYSEEQNPLLMDKVSGTVTLKDSTGASQEVKLAPYVPQKGEPAVYFCTMYDSPPQMAPGKCPVCGMNLMPQGGLLAAADLSKARPGSLKAVVHLTGLDGDEKEVTFTMANAATEEKPEKAEHSSPKASDK
jgi:hypothetical protein